ncbi:MAG: GntP family permease, partial [Clostridia bacterium]|nr:GntP family permease [Clostridia bacterium]
VLMFVPGYLYLEYRVRQVRTAGLGFTEDPKHKELEGLDNLPSWHWLCGLVPLIVVVLMLNLLPKALAGAGLA